MFDSSQQTQPEPSTGENSPFLSASPTARTPPVNQENATSDPVSGLNLFQAHLLKPVA